MTLQPNANWLAANDALVKQPIYAVNIDGADEWYHDREITSGTTGDFHKFLVDITAVEQIFNPVRSEASIGGFTFELLTSAAIWNFDELFQAPVIVMAGYRGLDWSDFELAAPTSYIQNIQANSTQTGFIFTCQDIQQQMNKDIMTEAINTKGTAESGTANTLVDTARVEADDFFNGMTIKLVDGVGAGQTRTISDFDQGTNTITVSANWDTNPDATTQYQILNSFFDARNPVTFWLQIMTTITGDTSNGAYDVLAADQGLGIDQALVDITECELIRDDFLATWQGEWSILEEVNAKTFFQDEIYRSFALTPVIKVSGKISLRPILPALFGYTQANNMGSALTDADIIELPKWQTDYRELVNHILFSFAFNSNTEAFGLIVLYTDDDSIAENGIHRMTLESKGIAGPLDGFALTQLIANRYFQRYATLPAKIQVKTKFAQRIIEPGDRLEITSSRIPNVDDSSFDWVSRGAEVQRIAPDFGDGVINLTLIDDSTGSLKYGVILAGGADDHTDASDADKAKGVYVSPTLDGTIYSIL